MPAQLSLELVAEAQPLLKGIQQVDNAVNKLGTDAAKSFNTAARAADNFEKQVTAVGKGADKSMRAVQGASANMAAQFQDIAVQAQSGTASMTIALQQGTQLAAVMQGLATSGGGLKALGSALLSIVNPISLITIGLVYAGAELAKFFLAATQVKQIKLSDAFKEIDAALKEVNKSFPGATKEVEEFHAGYAESVKTLQDTVTTASKAVIQAQSELFEKMATGGPKGLNFTLPDAQPAVAQLAALRQAASDGALSLEELDTWQEAAYFEMTQLGPATAQFVEQVIRASDALRQFTDPTVAALMAQIMTTLASGGDISGFVAQLNEIARTGATEAMRNDAAAAAQLLGVFSEASSKLAAAKTALDDFTGSMGAAVGRTAELATTTDQGLNAALQQFAVDMVNGKTSTAQFVAELARVRDATPNQALKEMINNVIASVVEIWKIPPAWAAGTREAWNFVDAANAATKAAKFAAAAQRAGALALAGNMTAASKELTTMVEGHVNALKDERQQLKETYDAAQLKATSVEEAIALSKQYQTGLNAIAEAERRVTAAKADRAASKGGGPTSIDGMTVDELTKWAHALEIAVDPTIKLREEQAKLAAAAALLKIPAEQQALMLAKLEEQYGKATTKAFDYQKTMEQMMVSWGNSVASSFATAIVEGKDLGQVFQDLIKQLIQMALEMLVLKPLMQSIGAAFGGGGATAGWGAALPFGASTQSASMYPAPGMLGARNATTSGGGSNTVNSNVGGITINFGGGGPQAAGEGQKAQKFAQRIRDVVQKEIVQQSRPGGLLWGRP